MLSSSVFRFPTTQNVALLKCHPILRHFLAFKSTTAAASAPSPGVTSLDLLNRLDLDSLRRCQLEFNSGAGGTEAALFAAELYNMYAKFAARNGWHWTTHEMSKCTKTGGTGINSAIVLLEGDGCYAKMRFESGVHRVQRVPVTEAKGRMHTSTVSLAVLPEPEKPEVMYTPDELKEEHMRSSGPGGANVNAISTCVRLTHKPTGTSVKVMDERYLAQNVKIAHQRLAAMLLKQQVDEATRRYASNRTLRVGTMERAEKIRTYNYKDNRMTDHRLKLTRHGVEQFLAGGEQLEKVVDLLMAMYEREGLGQQDQKQLQNP
uniref:Peptide chain release factor domain-containing protein n=1 Tax=Globodera rostochiensis TaxID=31243 RepID=A0A914GSX2_GLORO